jgi:hypothetical protein
MRILFRLLSRTLPVIASLCVVADARAEVEFNVGGKIQTDLRFRTETKSVGGFYNKLEARSGISRNENIFKLKLDASLGRFTGVAELDFVLYGYSAGIEGVDDLTRRELVDPYRIEAHALYVEAIDFLTEGLDLRVGQQLVLWGKGDQFNPTNNLNANDVEDPLLFGEQQANLMLRVDYTPGTTWTFSGVLVPIFRAALVPDSAPLGTAAVDRVPVINTALRHRLHAEKAMAQYFGYPTMVAAAIPVLPEASLDNMQGALRVAGTVFDIDVALSYYVGRTDVPQAYLNYSRLNAGRRCNPLDSTECIDGRIETDVYLAYPRMQVVGLNVAGQVNALGWLSSKIRPIGYRLEVGLYMPQAVSLTLLQEQILTQPAGEYEYNLGVGGPPQLPRPLVVEDTPFAKWTLGLDYTFGKHVMLNAQWVHGMVDEYGAGDFITEGYTVRKGSVTTNLLETLACQTSLDGEKCASELLTPRLGDYLVLGLDVRLMSDKLLLRLFTIWGLNGITEEYWDKDAGQRVSEHHSMFSDKGFTAVIYPEINYNFGHGLDLGAGALLMLGKDHTRFGDPATGGSQVFTRARWQF